MATYSEEELKKLEVKSKLSGPKIYTEKDLANMESAATPTPREMERTGVLGNIPTNAEIRPSSWYEGLIGDVLRGIGRGAAITRGAATGAEMTPGGAIPKAVGAVAGGMFGNTVYQGAQQVGKRQGNQRILGAPPTDVKGALTESVLETLLELGGGKALEFLSGPMKGALPFDSLKRSVLGAPTIDSEMAAAMRAHPDVPLTTGMATGSNIAKTAEGILAPGRVQGEFIEPAQKLFGGKVKAAVSDALGKPPGVSVAQTGGELAVKSYNDLRSKVLKEGSDLYEGFKEAAVKNGDVEKIVKAAPAPVERLDSMGNKFVDPFAAPAAGSEIVELTAPIYFRNSSSAASKMTEQLKAAVQELQDANVPVDRYSGYLQLIDQLKPIADPEMATMAKGTPVVSWEQFKGIRSAMADAARQVNRIDALPAQKALKTALGGNDGKSGFVGSLTKDKIDSAALWSKETRDALETADNFHKGILKRWPKSDPMLKRLEAEGVKLKNGIVDPEDVPFERLINEALTDPVTARNFTRMTGTSKPLAAEFVNRAFEVAHTVLPDGTDYWDGRKALQYMTDNAAVMGVVSNSKQRQDWKRLAMVMSRVPPEASRTGRTSVLLYGGVTGLGVATAAVSSLSGETNTNALARGAAVMGFIPMSQIFASKVLLKPGKARQLAALMETPPGTPRHNWLSKTFLEGTRNLVVRPMHDDGVFTDSPEQ